MRKMVKLFLTGMTLLVLSGCGTSNLSYTHQQIYVQIDDVLVQIKGKELQTVHDSYGSLLIEQKILQLKEGNIVVYEDARTDTQYEFEKGISTSVKVVFDAKRIYIIYAKNHLYVYQLLLQSGQILNLIAQQDDSQQLRIVYGMSSKQVNAILKTLDTEAKAVNYSNVITIRSPKNAIKSKWNVQKVHFYPLVSPLPKMVAL